MNEGRKSRDERDEANPSAELSPEKKTTLMMERRHWNFRLSLLSRRHDCHAVTSSHRHGFTLIELLVVMAIIATLLTLAVPRYFHSTDRAKEAVLRQDLAQMRDAIDKFYGDRGRYPDSLEDLVTRKYLRKVPPDPITDSTTTWLAVPPDEAGKGGVFDVKSGAAGTGLDGSAYDKW